MNLTVKSYIVSLGLLLISCVSGDVRHQGIKVPERYGASEYSQLSEEAKRRCLYEYYFYDRWTVEAILRGKVFKGMTTQQALFSWGKPDKVDSKKGPWGVYEKWLYEVDTQGNAGKYLQFKNGRLEKWKE